MNSVKNRLIGTGLVMFISMLMGPWEISALEISQQINDRLLMVSLDRRLYVIDFSAGTASQLPVAIDSSSIFLLSPDQNYFVVSGLNGVSVFRFTGSTVGKVGQITESPSRGIGWSTDGKTLSYTHEIRNPDGSVSIKIYLWTRDTGQTKRLL